MPSAEVLVRPDILQDQGISIEPGSEARGLLDPESQANAGMILLTRAWRKFPASVTAMAADIALSSKNSRASQPDNNRIPSIFQPEELGTAFLANPGCLRQFQEEFYNSNPQVCEDLGLSGAKDMIVAVFPFAQRMMRLKKDQLSNILAMHYEDPRRNTSLSDETQLRRVANCLIADAEKSEADLLDQKPRHTSSTATVVFTYTPQDRAA